MYTAILVHEPSTPKPTWTNCLLTRALQPVLRRLQRLYTFPPLCHLIQPFQKALKLFTLPPSAGLQGNKGAVSPNDVGRLVQGRGSICTAARSMALSFSRKQLFLIVVAPCQRTVPLGGQCGPGGLMGKEGVRELGLGPHSGPGRPLLQFKTNKWNKIQWKKKKDLPEVLSWLPGLQISLAREAALK